MSNWTNFSSSAFCPTIGCFFMQFAKIPANILAHLFFFLCSASGNGEDMDSPQSLQDDATEYSPNVDSCG